MLKKIVFISLFLVFLINLSGEVLAVEKYFTFATPQITWATLKFAIDTKNKDLFISCFPSDHEVAKLRDKGIFEEVIKEEGAHIQCSRAIRKEVKGNKAVLYIDFFGREKKASKNSSKALVDRDPVKLIKISNKWLIKNI